MSEEVAPDIDPEIKAIVDEAKEDYDLQARLSNRVMRTKSVTAITDEPKAEEHLALENKINALKQSVTFLTMMQTTAREIGLPEAAEALQPLLEEAVADPNYKADEIAALEAERDALATELVSTALVFHMRAVPPIIIKDARRQAKKKLGITGKNVPEAQDDLFTEYVAAYTLSAVVQDFTDNKDGSTHKLDPDNARFLSDQLPEGEYGKIAAKLEEIQFKNVVSQSITDQASFSPGI